MSAHVIKRFDAGVLHVNLNNPEKHNALTDEMMRHLTDIFRAVGKVEGARVIVLRGEGKAFCSGVDLRHMEEVAEYTKAQHKQDVKLLADLFEAIVECPLPVIAIGHGNIFGAGIGLLAAADIAVAFEATSFCFSEVNLGLVPGIISPYVVTRIGLTNARRYFLTAEIFQSTEARNMGLVNFVGAKQDCFDFLNSIITNLKKGAPGAQAETKKLMDIYTGHARRPVNLPAYLIELTANRRFSKEGHEGVHAFLSKEDPPWRK